MTSGRRLAVAGCLGSPPGSGSATPTTSPPAGEVLTVSEANATRVAGEPASLKANVSELPADQRDEFLAALEADVREPAHWGPGTDVQYVRHQGTWYFVTVVVVN